MPRKRAVLKIYGLVQGVFFRDFVRKQAARLKITGWTKNEPDGAVKVIAEGELEDLKKLVALCYSGPSAAEVEKIDIDWQEFKAEFKDFEIRL
jgi:acylphosphatase